MRLEFATAALQRLYHDPQYNPKEYGTDLIKAYRKKVGLLAAASDEQELRSFRSLRLEKLVGDRAGQSSVRLNDQWRLILRFRTGTDGRIAIVIEIVDYH